MCGHATCLDVSRTRGTARETAQTGPPLTTIRWRGPSLVLLYEIAARVTPEGAVGPLAEHFRSGHSGADPLELFNGDAVEAAFTTRFLDGPDHHAAHEGGDLLHPLGGSIIPRNGRRRFAAVLDRRPPGGL